MSAPQTQTVSASPGLNSSSAAPRLWKHFLKTWGCRRLRPSSSGKHVWYCCYVLCYVWLVFNILSVRILVLYLCSTLRIVCKCKVPYKLTQFSVRLYLCCYVTRHTLFLTSKFPTSSRGFGSRTLSCLRHDGHGSSWSPSSANRGLPASSVSSLQVSATPLAGPNNVLRMRPIQATSWKCVRWTSTLKSTEAFWRLLALFSPRHNCACESEEGRFRGRRWQHLMSPP